jgi:hypothetical protein
VAACRHSAPWLAVRRSGLPFVAQGWRSAGACLNWPLTNNTTAFHCDRAGLRASWNSWVTGFTVHALFSLGRVLFDADRVEQWPQWRRGLLWGGIPMAEQRAH